MLLQQSELRCQQTMHLLADMELMARADYLVGTLLPYEACFRLHYDHLPEAGCAGHAALDTGSAIGGTCTALRWHMIAWLHRFTASLPSSRGYPSPREFAQLTNALRLQALTNFGKGPVGYCSLSCSFLGAQCAKHSPDHAICAAPEGQEDVCGCFREAQGLVSVPWLLH